MNCADCIFRTTNNTSSPNGLNGIRRAVGVDSWRELYEFLRKDSSAQIRNEVISAITTNETSFFRDQHPFDAFRDHLLPQICQTATERRKNNDRSPIRIWSAAAATGQEAYTLSMLIHEHLRLSPNGLRPHDFHILGTDISARALTKATTGVYSDFELSRGLPEDYRKFFTGTGEDWSVTRELRSMVEFQQFNLTTDISGLGLFDAIFCRNVLIYFDNDTKVRILNHFSKMLRPGCHLVLGSTESVYGLSTAFKQIRLGKAILYRVD